MTARVRKPGRFTRQVTNRIVAWLCLRGVSLAGAQVLSVRGRKSGEWRRTPVNPLRHEGHDYLVAARGHVQWTRNMRVAGGGRLQHGRHVRYVTATEVPDAEKPDLLRAYLRRWKWEVGAFFQGLGPDSTDEQLLAVAADHPVFRLVHADGADRRAAG